MSAENYMRIIDLRGKTLTRAEMLAAMPRAEMGTDEATELVQPILDNVKRNGAKALREYAERFDHVVPKKLRVPADVMDAAVAQLDPEVRAAIEESIRRARAVAQNQVPVPVATATCHSSSEKCMRWSATATSSSPSSLTTKTA